MDDRMRQGMSPYAEIRYVAMGEITIYLVSEDELRLIEQGEPSSTYLNLAILFLSVGASFLASLLLSEPKSIKRFIVVIVITVGCLIAGFVLLILWRRFARNKADTIKRIRARRISPSSGNVVEASTS
jgi:hypothetical protein